MFHFSVQVEVIVLWMLTVVQIRFLGFLETSRWVSIVDLGKYYDIRRVVLGVKVRNLKVELKSGGQALGVGLCNEHW